MRRILLFFLTGLALLLLGVALVGQWVAGRENQGELPVYGVVPEFRLRNQGDLVFQRDNLEGRIWVAAFAFTRCRGQCPVMLSALQRIRSVAAGGGEPRIVVFTVDPEHDMAPVLRGFRGSLAGADSAAWTFLTGERDSIFEFARRGLLLGVEAAAGDSLEPILHSSRLVLVDREAQVRGYYDGLDAADVERLMADLRRLLAAPGS